MSEPKLPLWTKDNSDVSPAFQLTFGHALFRGLPAGDWHSTLFNSLGVGSPSYSGPLQQPAIPRHTREKCLVLGSANEIHLVIARLGNVWSLFGPHDFFFATKKWMDFNGTVGGLLAFATQMDADSFSYLVFDRGIKQTNAFVEGESIRVVHDTPMAGYIGKEMIFEDKAKCSLSSAEVRDFIEHDLAIQVGDVDQLRISQRFPRASRAVEDVAHFIFQRSSAKKGFLGIRW